MAEIVDTPARYEPAGNLLVGRVILVTGAGAGLGRATALLAARLGATSILLGRTVKKLEGVYDEIEAAGGKSAIYPMNLAGATLGDIFELSTTIEREFGRLDGIAHCAAHFAGFAPLSDEKPKDWMDGLQVNLTAAHHLTRVCLPLLAQSADASVVFVADPAGRETRALRGVYGVSKAAIEALAKAWALEQEAVRSLRFNTYDPGPMRTELRARGYLVEALQGLPGPEAAAPGLIWLLGPDSAGNSGRAYARAA
jgi:NAD(P)-dependent dehydrogenase (short-subunit alcohol dehydrogenase family)